MSFTATTFNSGAAPGIDAGVLNTMQTQYLEAILSWNPDLLTPCVLTGYTAVKDGSIATQLDVALGTAYAKQTDNTLRQIAKTASTQSTVGHTSATMYLFLKNDGTWQWSTTSTGPTNSLAICTVTTDASANISTVTDTRPLNTTLLSALSGVLTLPSLATSAAKIGGQPAMVQGAGSYAGFHVYVQPGTPTGMVKGDCWIKTPF